MTVLTETEIHELIDWRRDFHAHPEMAYQEFRTAQKVAEHLKRLGYEVQTGVGKTGVVGLLRCGNGKTIMLRADMDCLPVQEENDVSYRSQSNGHMHACGHDGHTAILMATAKKLVQQRERYSGAIKLVFQPAEEGGNGAEKMIEQGVLQNPRVDAAFGLHLWTSLPVGQVALNPGPLMAGVDSFEVTIIGKGGHGAAPHQTVDPIVTTAQVITALQSVVSRNVDPLATAVVTVGSVHAGNAFNVIAETATFEGTVRYFDRDLGNRLPLWIERVVRGVCDSLGATYNWKYEKLTPPTINDPAMAEFIGNIAGQIVGKENVRMNAQTMGGEDMSFFLEKVPGCYFFIGGANQSRGLINPHHSSRFDFDENAMELGVQVFCRAVEKFLA